MVVIQGDGDGEDIRLVKEGAVAFEGVISHPFSTTLELNGSPLTLGTKSVDISAVHLTFPYSTKCAFVLNCHQTG